MKRVKSGFTLIELMIVVSIIGILATTAIPSFQEYVRKAKLTEAVVIVGALAKAQTVNYYQNDFFIHGPNLFVYRSDSGQGSMPINGGKFPIQYTEANDTNGNGLHHILLQGTQSYFSYGTQAGAWDEAGEQVSYSFDGSGQKTINRSDSTPGSPGLQLSPGSSNDYQDCSLTMTADQAGLAQAPNEHWTMIYGGSVLQSGSCAVVAQMMRGYQGQVSQSPILQLNIGMGEYGDGGDDGGGDDRDGGGGDDRDGGGGDDRDGGGGDDRDGGGGDDRDGGGGER